MKNIKQPFFRYNPTTLEPIEGYPRKLPLTRYMQKQTEISNIVITCTFPHKYVHLDEIKRKYSKYSKYAPSKFPALDIKFKKFDVFDFSVTYLIYASGKINILGTTNNYSIDMAFKKLVDIISDTHRSFKLTELDMAWKYSYFKLQLQNRSLHHGDTGNITGAVALTNPLRGQKRPRPRPTSTSGPRDHQRSIIDPLTPQSPPQSPTQPSVSKRARLEPPRSDERQLSFKYPEYYAYNIHGITNNKNPHGNILKPLDFMCRAHQIFMSK